MKYLVTWKLLPVPPEMAKTALALIEATEAWIEAEKKAGHITGIWAKADGTGGVAIDEMESNDALYKKLMESPYSPFLEYCVIPLTDMKLALKIGRDFLKKIAGD